MKMIITTIDFQTPVPFLWNLEDPMEKETSKRIITLIKSYYSQTPMSFLWKFIMMIKYV